MFLDRKGYFELFVVLFLKWVFIFIFIWWLCIKFCFYWEVKGNLEVSYYKFMWVVIFLFGEVYVMWFWKGMKVLEMFFILVFEVLL